MGSIDTTAESDPKILPALQNKSVISVVLGDYHNGALTSTGKLLTWGNYSRGALGLGDPTKIQAGTPGGFLTERQREGATRTRRGVPPPVDVPTEVRFDHGSTKDRKMFCFAATAAGWHMGALVIDLEVSFNQLPLQMSLAKSILVCSLILLTITRMTTTDYRRIQPKVWLDNFPTHYLSLSLTLTYLSHMQPVASVWVLLAEVWVVVSMDQGEVVTKKILKN
jgi:hypothetical protein